MGGKGERGGKGKDRALSKPSPPTGDRERETPISEMEGKGSREKAARPGAVAALALLDSRPWIITGFLFNELLVLFLINIVTNKTAGSVGGLWAVAHEFLYQPSQAWKYVLITQRTSILQLAVHVLIQWEARFPSRTWLICRAISAVNANNTSTGRRTAIGNCSLERGVVSRTPKTPKKAELDRWGIRRQRGKYELYAFNGSAEQLPTS
ncbi:hypothetical protein GGX14DRAFT_385788 [Mycena pura]|uniref:Uncharacterized protein n=1 Tax=Mycena pura TaxID=153505 RepID=A0AAD6YRD5_9AGAR|nr:hypothetical protein GGX14DRAFT_385788 [Mycena pura]